MLASYQTNDKIDAADTVKKLLLAVKNYSLYPTNHHILVNSNDDLIKSLQAYLQHCSQLVIAIDKTRLLSDGNVLHQGGMDKNNIAFLLYRDGIQWISFQSGLEADEVTTFLEILNRYRKKEEYDGSDIVAALWQADLVNLKYGVNDLLWKDEPILDIASLKVSDPERPFTQSQTAEQRMADSLASPERSASLWELTPIEREQTGRMIDAQEHRNNDLDAFDILLVILKEQNKKDDYTAVLDLLRECFQHTLLRGEFGHCLSFLKNLRQIYTKYKDENFWALPYLEDFYAVVPVHQLFEGLNGFLQRQKEIEPEKLDELLDLIRLLPAQCVIALGKLLPAIKHRDLRRCVMKSMVIQSRNDINPLESLTRHENEKISQQAIALLPYIKSVRAIDILKRLIQSSHDQTRIAAVKAMIRHPDSRINDFGNILEDKNQLVIDLFLDHLNRNRDRHGERKLLDRVASGRFRKKDIGSLIKLYDALGHCGSESSLPFLQKQLFGFRLFPGAVVQAHRQGAIMALVQLKQEKARKMLDRASKSMRIGIRRAHRQAMEVINGPSHG